MRRVSVRRGAALLALIAILTVSPAVLADDTFPPPSPEAKIGPPGGAPVQATAESHTPIGFWEVAILLWLAAKIGPPIG
jgi:hypothetical protein